MPAVLHWGADLGDVDLPRRCRPSEPPRPHSSPDVRGRRSTLLARQRRRHPAPPALRGGPHLGSALGRWPRSSSDDQVAQVTCTAAEAGLTLTTHLGLDDAGVLLVRHELRNGGTTAYALDRLGVVLPVPPDATELLDLTGRWCRERHPQRHPLGRAGHLDPRLPARPHRPRRHPAAGRRHHRLRQPARARCGACTSRGAATTSSWAERRPDGRAVLGGGELLGPGEVLLEPGESYRTPDVLAVFSDDGLDGLSRRLHRHVRARPSHPRRPRPVVLNTWEAVYFDHGLDRLAGLADVAAAIGVERFVLDDGWFLHRRHDRAGLGDWTVDPEVWPDGLGPLVEHVRGLGMEFGLWVEPEMVNPDSDLLPRAPRLGAAGRRPSCRWPGGTSRCSTSACPRPGQHLLERLDALLTEYDIGYLKWDHNRDLVDADHDGRPAVHGQTLAVYRLLDELRRRHPERGDRVLRLRRRPGRPRHPGAHRPGLGQRHATTRWSARRSSAGPSCCCRPSWSAATSGRPGRTPPAARTTCRSAGRPRCSATSASSGTSPGWTTTSASG